MNTTITRKLICFFSVLIPVLSPVLLAGDVVRTWIDQSGSFQVEAELLKVKYGNVYLLKTDDNILTVPLLKLSAADQEFLKELLLPGSSSGIELLTAVPKNLKELPVNGRELFIKAGTAAPPLKPDPMKVVPRFRDIVQPIVKFALHTQVTKPLLVNPDTSTFAFSAYLEKDKNDEVSSFGLIGLTGPQGGKPRLTLNIDETLHLLDHDIASDRSVASVGFGNEYSSKTGAHLILIDKLSTGKPDILYRWRIPDKANDDTRRVYSAKMVSDKKVLAQVDDELFLWNLVSGELEFKITNISKALSDYDISASGKYLAIAVRYGSVIVNLETGKYEGQAISTNVSIGDVRFSPDGEKLAVTSGSKYLIWDLKQGQVKSEVTLSGPIGDVYGWVDNRFILTKLEGLIDTELGMSLWEYSLGSGIKAISAVPGGVVYTTSNSSRGSMFYSHSIPHGPVKDLIKRLTGKDEELMSVRPGTEVSLAIEAIEGVDKKEMYNGLKAAVEKAGWKVVQSSPIQVMAIIGQSAKVELTVRSFGNPDETVSITPFTALLKVVQGEQTLWSRSSVNRVTPLLLVQDGETTQQAVTQFEKPDYKFFEEMKFPTRILRPELHKAAGRSRIDSNNKWSDSINQF